MRARRKKNLTPRYENCKCIVMSASTSIYRKPEVERYNLISLENLFKNSNPVHMEIGCGKGAFLIEMAKRNPNVNYIGVEILSNIIVSAGEQVESAKLENVKFLNMGAEILHYFIPKKSIDKLYLNFSCPYPKKQYENHRLTYKYFLEIYKKLLKSGAEIHQKTDSDGLYEYSLNSYRENGFEVLAKIDDLYANLPTDNVATEYEKMKLKLWKEYEHNRDGYTNAKAEFVQQYTEKAKLLYGNRNGLSIMFQGK